MAKAKKKKKKKGKKKHAVKKSSLRPRKPTKSTIKKRRVKKTAKVGSKLRQSKTDNFLENIRKNNSMIEYITKLRIMNPAAQILSDPKSERREGGFVRLAHANEEFPAPVLNKGKAFEAIQREKAGLEPAREKGSEPQIDDKDE